MTVVIFKAKFEPEITHSQNWKRKSEFKAMVREAVFLCCILFYYIISFYSILFIFFREGERKGWGVGAEGEGRENPKQIPSPAWNPTQGSISQPQDPDLS